MTDPNGAWAQLELDHAATGWRVQRAEVSERFEHPTEVVVYADAEAPVDLDALVGVEGRLEFRVQSGDARTFSGVVVDTTVAALTPDRFTVEVTLRSRLALLGYGRDHRIFQEMSVPDIVDDVFARSGLQELLSWSTTATYEPHPNVVQYGESDLDFVLRLLAEEGIGLVVDNDDAGELVVLFDDDSAFRELAGGGAVAWLSTRGAGRGGLDALSVSHRAVSDQAMLNDYDPLRPGADQRITAAADGAMAREVYLHPGGYVDADRGQRLADRLLERLQLPAHTLGGGSNIARMAPGRTFTPAVSPRAQLDDHELVVTAAKHVLSFEAGDAGYRNELSLVPRAHPHRPAERPPAVIPGVQHAVTTVPGGEEIHADENGRVKVRFLWDRSGLTDDASSTWLRVGQLALGGSMVLPRIDFEVLVDHELGDLDRPAVSGHLYHAELPPPYALPAGCTVSSMQTATTEGGPGANELRFEDSAGAEEIYIHASKDMQAAVDHDTTWTVHQHQRRAVGNDDSLSVVKHHGAEVVGSRTLEVGANQSVTVGGQHGDGTGEDLSLTVRGNRMVKTGGDHTEEVQGSLSRTVGSLSSFTGLTGYTRNVAGDATLDVGAVHTEISVAARGTSIGTSYSETVGALKLIKAENVGVNAGAAYSMTCAAESVKADGGRSDTADGAVTMTAGGAMKVKAQNIVFEASSKLVFRGGGGSIELTSAGAVKIKASKVTVENSEALNQLVHKSG